MMPTTATPETKQGDYFLEQVAKYYHIIHKHPTTKTPASPSGISPEQSP
jgi:hypothetical protein